MGFLRDDPVLTLEDHAAESASIVLCELCGLSCPQSKAEAIANRRLVIGGVGGGSALPLGLAAFDPASLQSVWSIPFAFLLGGLAGTFAATWDWHALGHVVRLGVRFKGDRLVFDRREFAALLGNGPTSAWITLLAIAVCVGAYSALGVAGAAGVIVLVAGVAIGRSKASVQRAVGTSFVVLGFGIASALLPQVLRFVSGNTAALSTGVQASFGCAAMLIAGGLLLRGR